MKNITSNDITKLNNNLEILNKLLSKETNIRWIIVKSAVSGFVYMIGATLVFGMFIWSLNQVAQKIFDRFDIAQSSDKVVFEIKNK